MEDERITTAPPTSSESSNLLTPGTRLVDIPIQDENTALNVMVNFLALAQKRGVFGLDESAKIWECVKMFQK